ncbi:MAG: hypothetical protein A6F72_04975 [Cycloclasticus sp. symbiont of Poecilosclerida sp. N]|nr:MAG: hypothetical protein A6F72_04975 [Cycloclasticus sp. symbiont of Poecilosclerida sp. N]
MYILTYIVIILLPWLYQPLQAQRQSSSLKPALNSVLFEVEKIIADNDGEFKGEFDSMLSDAQITQLWTYPSTPKMNAVCECFNLTIQEQFVDYH